MCRESGCFEQVNCDSWVGSLCCVLGQDTALTVSVNLANMLKGEGTGLGEGGGGGRRGGEGRNEYLRSREYEVILFHTLLPRYSILSKGL